MVAGAAVSQVIGSDTWGIAVSPVGSGTSSVEVSSVCWGTSSFIHHWKSLTSGKSRNLSGHLFLLRLIRSLFSLTGQMAQVPQALLQPRYQLSRKLSWLPASSSWSCRIGGVHEGGGGGWGGRRFSISNLLGVIWSLFNQMSQTAQILEDFFI